MKNKFPTKKELLLVVFSVIALVLVFFHRVPAQTVVGEGVGTIAISSTGGTYVIPIIVSGCDNSILDCPPVATATLTVNLTVSTPSITHKACSGSTCSVVSGSGPDTCSTNANCAPSPTHKACSGSTCSVVSGSGPNTCNTNANCGGGSYSCVNNSCVPATSGYIPGVVTYSSESYCQEECGGGGGGGNGGNLPTLVVAPADATTTVGSTASFTTYYDSDGPSGSQAGQNVTPQAGWSSSNASTAVLLSPGLFKGVSTGTVSIYAAYEGLNAEATLRVVTSSGPTIIEVPP